MSSKTAPIPFKPLNFDTAAAAADKFADERNIPALAFPQRTGGGGEKAVEPSAMTSTPDKARQANAQRSEAKPLQRVPVVLPEYVVADIKQRALDARTSNRFIIMQALRKGGIFISDDDMVEDGRRLR